MVDECKTRGSFFAVAALIMLVLLTSAEPRQGADYGEHDDDEDDDDTDDPFYPGNVDAENEKKDEPPGICYFYKPTENKLEPRCCQGWETISISTDAFPTCRPICSPPCVNGSCEQYNICRCLPGYHMPENVPTHKCVPECQPPCLNSDCVGPNKCRCRPGFSPSLFSNNVCRNVLETHVIPTSVPLLLPPPSCIPKCVLGRCAATNNCTCYPGYVSVTDRPWECTPHCHSCDGALERCEGPDMCKCVEGYTRDEHGSCVPHCQTPCYYGRCVAPNKCECHEGYVKEREMCFPTCNPPCGRHGECVSINNCSCDDEFILGPDGACMGKCTAEEQWDSLSSQCVPLQNPTMKTLPSSPALECPWPCVRGVCEDEKCVCEPGWGDIDCGRTCKVLPDSNKVDPEDCPALKRCSCPHTTRTTQGIFCEEGFDAECNDEEETVLVTDAGETDLTEPSAEMLYIPEWALLVAAVGAGVLMLLLVAIPSAVALHRRHRRQKRQREDDEQTRILQTKGAGRGRMQDVDLDEWRFIPQ